MDPPLSERGRDQAYRLADRLRDRRFAGFYSSDLRRALETAAAIAEAIGQEPVVMRELREIGVGEWEGLTRDELAQRYPAEWEQWVKLPSWDVIPGSEGAAVFEERVGRAVDGIFERHPDGDVLLVSHGGFIQVALGRVFGRRSDGRFPLLVENASISVLQRDPGGRVVIGRSNDTSHLD
jgi:alpha-ribazole phosphatase/probable phosphoglycerate mutase